jgi:hypothetical protein
MVDAKAAEPRSRRRFGAMGAVAAVVACAGCCAVPFLAGVSVFGVAVCSTRFLGASLLAAVVVGAVAGVIGYRVQRRRRTRSGPVPVELGPRR